MYINDTNLLPIRLNLDSKNYTAKYSNNSNFIYELASNIEIQPEIDMLVSLDTFVFTNSIYNINSNNCNLYYSFHGEDEGAVYHLKLTHGYYSIDDFLDYLKTTLPEFNFTYNARTLKVTISNTTRPFRLVSTFNNNINTVYSVLGFNDVITDTNLYSSIVGTKVFNMNTNSALKIVMDSNFNLNTNVVRNKNLVTNVIETIPIIASFSEAQAYKNTNAFKFICSNDSINVLSIQVLNQDNKPVDFNGANYYMSITIDFMYRKEGKIPTYLVNPELSLIDVAIDEEKNKLLKK